MMLNNNIFVSGRIRQSGNRFSDFSREPETMCFYHL